MHQRAAGHIARQLFGVMLLFKYPAENDICAVCEGMDCPAPEGLNAFFFDVLPHAVCDILKGNSGVLD